MPRPNARKDHDRAALAAALDPVITIDARGQILSASDSVRRVLGWTASELLGRNVSVLMPEPHRSSHDGYLAAYARTGRTSILNKPRRFNAQHKRGALVPIELCVSRATPRSAGPSLYVGIIRDMSAYAAAERTSQEERLRAQQQIAAQTAALHDAAVRLRTADRMAAIGTLAAGLGHDMNNVLLPVRSLLNAVAATPADRPLGRRGRARIGEIRRTLDYLQQLADGLHFLALDPESDSSPASTSLRQWWSGVGTLLSKAVPAGVRVRASFPARLPPVAITSHALTQAVLNLVVNAGESIPRPGPRSLVRLSAVRDGPRVHLRVADTGSGMSESVRRRALEPFFTTKTRGMGTGLGLSIVDTVVQRAGGAVSIESVPGRGTTVSLSLPATS